MGRKRRWEVGAAILLLFALIVGLDGLFYWRMQREAQKGRWRREAQIQRERLNQQLTQLIEEDTQLWYKRGVNLKRARTLLEQGADVKTKTQQGWTVLPLLAKYGDPDAVKFALDLGADIRASNGETALAMTLINLPHDPDEKDIRQKYIETALLLIERGADVNGAVEVGSYTYDPITVAVGLHIPGVVRSLLDHGVPIAASQRGPDYWPLDEAEPLLNGAIRAEDLKTIRLLLERGADPNEVVRGHPQIPTPLQVAQEVAQYEGGNKEALRLLQRSLKQPQTGGGGATPSDEAARK